MHHDRKGMRKSAADKASRLAHGDPTQKVDASSWTPPEPMNADVQTGMRPVSKRQFKRGGKVTKMEGHKAHQHMGRKPRKSGGRALTADSLINRSVKEANEQREGKKHVGAMKRGGSAHGHISHEDEVADKKLIKSMVKSNALRAHKFSGGVGENPLSTQNKMMSEAAGASHKRGGRAHHATDGVVKKKKPTGIEEGYVPTHYTGMDPNFKEASPEAEAQLANLAKTGSLKGHPTDSPDYPERKDGGKIKWIQKDIKHPGALHKALHVPEGKKIPMAKIKKAEHSSNPVLAKRAHLAENLRSFHADGGHVGHGPECRCHKCWGGAAEAKGDRVARKHGGSTKGKGKTHINIMIAPHGSHDSMGAGAGMAPPMPPMGAGAPPMPPMGAGAPPMPPMPPMGAGAPPAFAGGGHVNLGGTSVGHSAGSGAMGSALPGYHPGMRVMDGPGGGGGRPLPASLNRVDLGSTHAMRPPVVQDYAAPMMRKSGGRTGYPIETGSGGGEARLDKIKAYGLTPPRSARGR